MMVQIEQNCVYRLTYRTVKKLNIWHLAVALILHYNRQTDFALKTYLERYKEGGKERLATDLSTKLNDHSFTYFHRMV